MRKKYAGPSSAPRGNRARAHFDQWLTRKEGSLKQIGQKFPVLGSKSSLPRIRYKRATPTERARLTKLELDVAKAEREMLDRGQKGFEIGVKYLDGSTEIIPVIAGSYQEALKKARPKMNQIESQIDEIVICDPDWGEIAHKIGAGARRLAHGIARGVRMIPKAAGAVERAAIRTGRRIGRIAALPTEIQEAYEIGKKERPGITPAAPGEPARRVLTPDEASRLVAEAMRGAPLTQIEKAKIDAAPLLYRPIEEPMPAWYTPEALKAAQERLAHIPRKHAWQPTERINGRALRPFGIPMREYQLRSYHPGRHEAYEAKRVASIESAHGRVEQARRQAAWKARAPVRLER
jgi:hypothetical protein